MNREAATVTQLSITHQPSAMCRFLIKVENVNLPEANRSKSDQIRMRLFWNVSIIKRKSGFKTAAVIWTTTSDLAWKKSLWPERNVNVPLGTWNDFKCQKKGKITGQKQAFSCDHYWMHITLLWRKTCWSWGRKSICQHCHFFISDEINAVLSEMALKKILRLRLYLDRGCACNTYGAWSPPTGK